MSRSVSESMALGLRSIIEVTEILIAKIEADDFSIIPELLDRREALLETQNRLTGKWKDSSSDTVRRHEASELKSDMNLLHELDKKIVTLFSMKKEEFGGKLRQAHNQKRLLVYSR